MVIHNIKQLMFDARWDIFFDGVNDKNPKKTFYIFLIFCKDQEGILKLGFFSHILLDKRNAQNILYP